MAVWYSKESPNIVRWEVNDEPTRPRCVENGSVLKVFKFTNECKSFFKFLKLLRVEETKQPGKINLYIKTFP